jgi:hypothetical protein
MPSGSPSDSSPLGSSDQAPRGSAKGGRNPPPPPPAPHLPAEPSRFPHQHRHLHPQPRCGFRHRSPGSGTYGPPPHVLSPRSGSSSAVQAPALPPQAPAPVGAPQPPAAPGPSPSTRPPQEPSTLARSSALLPRRRATRHHPAPPRDLRPMLTPSPSRRRRSAPRPAPRVRVPFPRSSLQIRLNPRRPAMSSRPRDRHFRWTRVRTSPATSMKMSSRSSVRARLASSSACSSRSQVE